MNAPPSILNGARLLYYTTIDERHVSTEKTTHRVNNVVLAPAAALAVCQYENDDSFYLFYCDENWEPMTDTWHQTLEDAFHQVEFEYKGVTETWEKMNGS
jgi:hypothetical protein